MTNVDNSGRLLKIWATNINQNESIFMHLRVTVIQKCMKRFNDFRIEGLQQWIEMNQLLCIYKIPYFWLYEIGISPIKYEYK